MVIKLSSEKNLGITNQPEAQCPTIDYLKGKADNIDYYINEMDTALLWEDYKKAQILTDKAATESSDISSELEDLRATIIQLRQWGNEWKLISKWLINKYHVDEKEIIQYVNESIIE